MNVHPRKRYNNNGSNNNYRRTNRHSSGGHRNNSGGAEGSNSFGSPRPRKNFRALQEKYLNMAKDAMSSGDRILAEYYLQHADHYYRQNEEFLEERNKHNEQRAARRAENSQSTGEQENDHQDDADDDTDNDSDGEEAADVNLSTSGSALPDFLTRKASPKDANKVVPIQDWEE